MQARRRNLQGSRRWRLPRLRIPWRGIAAVTGMTAAGWVAFETAQLALRQPIRAVEIDATFQRVNALEVEAALQEEMDRGFFSADLPAMRGALEQLPWVDTASVQRQWPDTLRVRVVEHVAAARWGQSGLLNTRGELFVTRARHMPPELPRLSGPPGTESQVAARYLQLLEQLAETGMQPASVVLDARGAWRMTLSNGVQVRFGRNEVDARAGRFLIAAGGVLADRMSEVDYVDMRYTNGFSVGWSESAAAGGGDAHEGAPNG